MWLVAFGARTYAAAMNDTHTRSSLPLETPPPGLSSEHAHDATPAGAGRPPRSGLAALLLALVLAGSAPLACAGTDVASTPAGDQASGAGSDAAAAGVDVSASADALAFADAAAPIDTAGAAAPDAIAPNPDGASAAVDAGPSADAAPTNPNRAAFVPVSASEHALGGGWIGAGQPSEQRLLDVVKLGATVLSLRTQAEDPFDEPALVKGAGGTFIRYPVSSSQYQDKAFREALYDLYDAQMKLGVLVYLHCASSNRVGASWALYQAERKGLPLAEALAAGKAAGLSSLESMVVQILGG